VQDRAVAVAGKRTMTELVGCSFWNSDEDGMGRGGFRLRPFAARPRLKLASSSAQAQARHSLIIPSGLGLREAPHPPPSRSVPFTQTPMHDPTKEAILRLQKDLEHATDNDEWRNNSCRYMPGLESSSPSHSYTLFQLPVDSYMNKYYRNMVHYCWTRTFSQWRTCRWRESGIW